MGNFRVRRDKRATFLAMVESLRNADNALGTRGGAELAPTVTTRGHTAGAAKDERQ